MIYKYLSTVSFTIWNNEHIGSYQTIQNVYFVMYLLL